MKKVLFFGILLSVAITTRAQDIIVLHDGSTILSKVLEVNSDNIKYKKFSNLTGPTYTINKSELLSINYENGEKDSFVNNISSESQNIKDESSQRYIKLIADEKNNEILSFYNRNYEPTSRLKVNNSPARTYIMILGVKSSSIMSNDEIEMTFVGKTIPDRPSLNKNVYYINLKNKTDKTIYIDKANCFMIMHDGKSFSYYNNTEQTTVTSGGEMGASMGLGSIAGVLGVSGPLGQLANGIGIGGGSSHSVSTSYSQQRVIAIPPHGTINLTEDKWVKTKKGNMLNNGPEFKAIEKAEEFDFTWYNDEILGTSELGLKEGLVNRGEIKLFNEGDLTWKREYIVTYSTEESFRTFSTINSELYIREIIGGSKMVDKWHDFGKYIEQKNENTLVGAHTTR